MLSNASDDQPDGVRTQTDRSLALSPVYTAHRAARLHDIADEMGALFKDMLSGSVAVGDPYVPFSWSSEEVPYYSPDGCAGASVDNPQVRCVPAWEVHEWLLFQPCLSPVPSGDPRAPATTHARPAP